VVGGIVGFRVAVGLLKDKVVQALGPESEIKDLRVGWSSVEVEGLRIKGRTGWPASDALRAERVIIVPSLRSILSGKVRVQSITIVKPYLSALRTKDGKLQVVPSLLGAPPAQKSGGGAAPPVAIGRIALQDGVVEIFDATVASPPHKIRLEQLQATVHEVLVPALTGKSRFDLAGVLKGVQHDGRVSVSGWAEVATKDSSVKTELRKVDLVALQPYIIKAAEAGVQRGALDLDLQSDVVHNRLKAPGKATIADLELSPSKGALGTFMGVPRDAVVAFLKNKDNKITVNFVLEGDINNPQFSLNEAFSTRMASAMAENLGVSIRGLAQGVGTLGQKGVGAFADTAKGLGGALGGLLGGSKKR
jgi:hypothetical protein